MTQALGFQGDELDFSSSSVLSWFRANVLSGASPVTPSPRLAPNRLPLAFSIVRDTAVAPGKS